MMVTVAFHCNERVSAAKAVDKMQSNYLNIAMVTRLLKEAIDHTHSGPGSDTHTTYVSVIGVVLQKIVSKNSSNIYLLQWSTPIPDTYSHIPH